MKWKWERPKWLLHPNIITSGIALSGLAEHEQLHSLDSILFNKLLQKYLIQHEPNLATILAAPGAQGKTYMTVTLSRCRRFTHATHRRPAPVGRQGGRCFFPCFFARDFSSNNFHSSLDQGFLLRTIFRVPSTRVSFFFSLIISLYLFPFPFQFFFFPFPFFTFLFYFIFI